MPPFPGMGYPLVPGYESVGRVVAAGPGLGPQRGRARLRARRALLRRRARPVRRRAPRAWSSPATASSPVDDEPRRAGRAAGAGRHRLPRAGRRRAAPDLIVGHGVLGRLLARLTVADGGGRRRLGNATPAAPRGAERLPGHRTPTTTPAATTRHLRRQRRRRAARHADRAPRAAAARSCWPASTASRCRFAFPPAFMREARIRVAAEWQPARPRRRQGAGRRPAGCRSTA